VAAVRVKVDFDTRLVDLGAVQRGDNLELLKLFPLSGVEVTLQPVRSFEAGPTLQLAAFGDLAVASWVRDLTSSQLVGFIAGVGPLRPLAQLGAGAANVVLLPLRQYRVGGRPLYALRQGAFEFAKTFTVESAQASSRLSRFVASSLTFLTDGQPATNDHRRHASSAHAQPTGLGSGLALAQTSVSRGLALAGHAIIAVPLEDYHRGGAKGALKAAVRAIPVAVLAPVIGATEALSYTLLGIRNSLAPGVKHDEDAKFRHP
jgi:autophagy-related protein 2